MKPSTTPLVVVINDDVKTIQLMTKLLKEMNCQVLTFQKAEDALLSMSTLTAINLVITDLYMPEINGWSFCRLLRSPEFPQFNQTPILVTSSTFSGADALQISTDLEVNAFLSIPFKNEEFKRLTSQMMQGESPHKVSRVLLVDRPSTETEVLSHVLGLYGYKVETASTRDKVFMHFKNIPPEIAIINYDFLGRATETLLEELHALSEQVVLIVSTYSPTAELALNCTKKGADVYLRKPFEPRYLIELCTRAKREKSFLRLETLFEKRSKELEFAKNKIHHAAKMASLGEMAGGIAHEINTPLSTILMNTEYLLEDLKSNLFDKATTLKLAEKISNTTLKIGQIVKGLKSFSRDSSKDPFVRVTIGKLIEEVQALSSTRTKYEEIELCFEMNGFENEVIECRPSEITQVLINLLNNAFDAVETLQDKWIKVVVSEDGDDFKFKIVDSGMGIPEELHEKIMEPFFTTKESGKGTGLGLSISKGIAESHHGALRIDTNSLHTCFLLRLPKQQPLEPHLFGETEESQPRRKAPFKEGFTVLKNPSWKYQTALDDENSQFTDRMKSIS